MNAELLKRWFGQVGARVRVDHTTRVRNFSRAWRGRGLETRPVQSTTLDVTEDRRGELFLVRARPENLETIHLVHSDPERRHLLLMIREGESATHHKFLCGHDERHWFVAAIPERSAARTVETAMEALKPLEIRTAETRAGIRSRDRHRRRNDAFVRQGEWFFVPAPEFRGETWSVLRNEPLIRAIGSKAHMLEECVSLGGSVVYTHPAHPEILTDSEYSARLRQDPSRYRWGWTRRVRDPELYARGTVRHPDHYTIRLDGWHQVFMNTEHKAAAKRHVAFLD